MELLSPEKIKDEKKVGTEEARRRVSGLGKEESDLVLRINLLRHDEEDYLERKHLRETQSDAELGVTKTVLEREVEILEARKKVALEPIHSVEREANALMANAQQAALTNEELGKVLEEDKRALVARETAVKSEEEAQKVTRDALTARDGIIAVREEKIAQRTAQLAEDVAAHSLKVATDDAEMVKRENTVKAEARTNYLAHLDQEERARKQNDKDKEIEDRYAQLHKTATELGLVI